MPDGTFTQTDLVRPWAELTDEEKAMFCRMAEVYAGFSEYTDAQVGAHRRLPRGVGPAREHAPLPAPTTAHRARAAPNGSVNEGKIFGGQPRRRGAEPHHGRPARQPRHLQPLPDRMGDGVLDAVPHVQALLLPGRRLRSPSSSTGRRHRREGRGPQPVPPFDRHRADDPRGLRRRDARHLQRRRADAAPRASRWPTRSTRRPMGRPASRRSTTRCSAVAASGTRAGRP